MYEETRNTMQIGLPKPNKALPRQRWQYIGLADRNRRVWEVETERPSGVVLFTEHGGCALWHTMFTLPDWIYLGMDPIEIPADLGVPQPLFYVSNARGTEAPPVALPEGLELRHAAWLCLSGKHVTTLFSQAEACTGCLCMTCCRPSEGGREHAECAPKRSAQWAEANRGQLLAAARKATRVDPGYDGAVVWSFAPGGAYSGGCSDGMFASADDLLEWCKDHDTQTPSWVWACTETPLALDARDILDAALEQDDHHEDAIDGISSAAIQDLQTFLDAWLERADAKVISWHEDSTRVVVLDEAAFAAEVGGTDTEPPAAG